MLDENQFEGKGSFDSSFPLPLDRRDAANCIGGGRKREDATALEQLQALLKQV